MKVFFATICLTFCLFGFGELKGQFNRGFRVGLGCSYIKSGYKDIDNKFGYSDPLLNYSIGAFINKDILEKLNTGFELQLARKGYAYNIANYFDLESIIAKRTMYSANLNVYSSYELLKKIQKKKTISFGIIGGLYTSYLFHNKWIYGNNKPINVDESMKPFDFGFMTGLFWKKEHPKKRSRFCFDIRYSQGLIDIGENFERTTFHTFEVGVSYILSPSKRKS